MDKPISYETIRNNKKLSSFFGSEEDFYDEFNNSVYKNGNSNEGACWIYENNSIYYIKYSIEEWNIKKNFKVRFDFIIR